MKFPALGVITITVLILQVNCLNHQGAQQPLHNEGGHLPQLPSRPKVLALFELLWDGSTNPELLDYIQTQYNYAGSPIIKPGAERQGAFTLKRPGQFEYSAALAQAHGIEGFVYKYKWPEGEGLRNVLDNILYTSQISMPFCLQWHRIDQNKTSPAATQQNINQHFDWLLSNFQDKDYIFTNGKPVLLVDNVESTQGLRQVLQQFQAMAKRNGFADGLHIVAVHSVRGRTLMGSVLEDDFQGSSGGCANYHDFLRNRHGPINTILSNTARSQHTLHSLCLGYDDTPTLANTSLASSAFFFPSHPSIVTYTLRQMLAAAKPNDFILIHSWNDWVHGMALEPSIEWGRKWLTAVHAAVEAFRKGAVAEIDAMTGDARSIALPPAGVHLHHETSATLASSDENNRVCIIVRVKQGDAAGMFNLYQTLSSLVGLNHKHWDGVVAMTDDASFPQLPDIIEHYNALHAKHGHIKLVKIPHTYRQIKDDENVEKTYQAVDYLIAEHCLSEEYRWMLVTQGSSWYTPDALDLLPPDKDLVLMNYYSHSALAAAAAYSNAADTFAERCCTRLNDYHCIYSSPKPTAVDLGAMIMSVPKYTWLGKTFVDCVSGAAQHSGLGKLCASQPGTSNCLDGCMADFMVKSGWQWMNHGPKSCAMYLPASPKSCGLLGGIWYDAVDDQEAGCMDISDLPFKMNAIDYAAFMESSSACICSQEENPMEVF